jgi:hypothetical protein
MKQIKRLDCGCIIDQLNLGVIKFCEGHQEEHDIWLSHVTAKVN